MSDVIDQRHFRDVMGSYPTGVTVVAASTPDGPVGLAIGSFCSVSLDPPLVSFCPGHTSSSWPRIREAGSFCVSVLAEDQHDVSNVFAGRAADKFAEVEWTASRNGAPRIQGAVSWIDCDLHEVLPGGDHDIVLGLVTAMAHERTDVGPLLFVGGAYGRLG